MAVTKKPDFSQAVNEGVMITEPAKPETGKKHKKHKTEPPKKGVGSSLKDNLEKKSENEESRVEQITEPNPAASQVIEANSKNDPQHSEGDKPKKTTRKAVTADLTPVKKSKKKGDTHSFYLSDEAWEYLLKWKDNGYTISDIVENLILYHKNTVGINDDDTLSEKEEN